MTAAALAAIKDGNVPLVVLIEMDLSGGFIRVNNSSQNFTWNGYTWVGLGVLGSIGRIDENSDLSAAGITFQLSGVPQEDITFALAQQYQGRSLKMWIAPLNSNHIIIVDPIGPYEYRMDTMDIELGQTATITVSAESRLIDWERSWGLRYTDEEQRRLYPTDMGLQFVPQMAEKQIKWGY